MHAQSLGRGDVDEDVLAAGREDRVVEGLIAHRRAHPAARQILRHQGRQDPDHHDVRPVRAGLGLGGIQTGPDLRLQFQRGMARQRTWWNVEFDVVGAQFGLVGRIGNGSEHLLVGHRRLVVRINEIALDFHPGHRSIEFETRLRQHGLEDVQTELDLLPVFLPLLAAIGSVRYLISHADDATGSAPTAQVNPA